MPENASYTRRLYDLRDGRISAVHIGDTSKPVRVVFANANGFNGLAYRTILAPLGVHAIALDMRGQGMSELPADIKGLKNWQIFADDIAEFFDRCIDSPVILGGHSFGAASGIIASTKIKEKLAGYVGLDPVTMPFLPRLFSRLPGGRAMMKRFIPIAKSAGRRRFVFENQDAAFERYQNRGAFKGMSDAALNDYLEGGLKLHEDGVQLSCHPLWEQAIFAAQGSGLFRHLKNLPENTQIVYGGKSAVSTNAIRSKVSHKLRGGEVSYYRDFHHLFPFHEPEFVTDLFQSVIVKAKF